MERKRLLITPLLVFSLILVTICWPRTGVAQEIKKSFRVGYIGSMSSFAANYGQAALEGALLAVEQLAQQGIEIDLRIEDDQSIAKNGVNSFIKLTSVDKVEAIISGTWWANYFVKQAERENLLLLSCETLFNEDVVPGKTYFLLQGDLRDWIRAFEPLVVKKGWKRGAIVRYVSGFGATLEKEFESLFSRDGREFVGAVEYSEIQMGDINDIVLKLRRLKPEVVYIDAQPNSFGNLMRKMVAAGLAETAILAHSVCQDAIDANLFEPASLKEIYFTKRASYAEPFVRAFKAKYHREPTLNSDLGYYAVLIAARAIQQKDPIAFVKAGLDVEGINIRFDENNVFTGPKQEIFAIKEGQVIKWP